ncbi:hypothetical protein G5C60_31180 [Streptomyces sp. HC44]|uniref:Uncharacterized protein n=1 Tax=Streptomyces scabichelini TaxID=2711217 RepID=A0A6G4VCT6_9ACTN|nr:DUF6232 family protein [Streptomyces scabichelini]NGO11948.1 hypothetical protein [Streptomyces scabichelini]
MAKKRVDHIVLSNRVVRIGHEVYPLANISRVQTLRVVWGGRFATLYPLRQIIVVGLVAGVIVGAAVLVPPELPPDVSSDIEEAARQFASVVAVAAGVWMAFWLMVLLYRLLIRRRRYALVIETAGTQSTALTGTDPTEIQRIKNVIVGAIENPPPHEIPVQVHGDIVMGNKAGRDHVGGNQYNQSGSGNRMFT